MSERCFFRSWASLCVHYNCGLGLSDMHQLNGPELHLFIKKQLDADIISADTDKATKGKLKVLCNWMSILHDRLLSSKNWDLSDLAVMRVFVASIHHGWTETAGQQAFPKLHMLFHSVEFANRFKFLGRVSEAQIESFHFEFNLLYHFRHRNVSPHPEERLRRCLADSALLAVAPFADKLTAAPAPEPAEAEYRLTLN